MTHANHQGEPGDTGTGDEVERLAEIMWQAASRSGESIVVSQRALCVMARAVIASAPSPDPAGAGGDLGRLEDLVGRARLAALSDHTLYGNDAGSLYDDLADAIVDLLTVRSGKLVASTGSGKEETKGEPSGMGSREPGPSVPASGFDPSRAALRALRIGDMVRVNQSLDQPWTFDWQDGPYEVIGLALDRHGDPTVTLSHDGDVGSDGFDPTDLVLVAPCDGSAEGGETGTGLTEGNSAVREAEAPEATPQSSPSQTPVDPQMAVKAFRTAALTAIQDLRHAAACNFSPAYSGSLGEARCNSFYEAYEAVRKLAPSDALSTTGADHG